MKTSIQSALIAILILTVLIAGCSGLQIQDTANNKAIAYVAGKGIGLSINKFYPKLDVTLSTAWSDMMDRNAGQDVVSAEEIMDFYNSTLMALSTVTKDPYGLIGDLGALMTLYGSSFSGSGELIAVKPIPMEVLRYFEYGYKGGKNIAARELKLNG